MIDQLEGQTLGDYHLLEKVGHGGMTSVYRAVDLARNRVVAIKVLSPYIAQEPGFKTRFEREIELLGKLKHGNIVPILDFGEDSLHAYIVMPFLPEGTLQDRIQRAPLDPFEISRVMRDVSKALTYAHENGVVHRDVKASNILLDQQGRALLADFGFAHIQDISISLTGSALIGTPAYMSPEQSRGVEIDERSDQYSLGIVLYQLFTGVLPFEGETPMAVAMQHINEPLPRPRKFKPDLPVPIERVLMKALAKDPADRFGSVAEMNTSLQEALRESVDAIGRFVPQEPRFNLATWIMERTPLGEPISTVSHWWDTRRPALITALLFLMLLPTVGYALASMQADPEVDASPQLSGGENPALQATIDALSTNIALESGEEGLDPSLIEAAVAGTLSAQARLASGRPTVTPGLFRTPTATLQESGGLASLPNETEAAGGSTDEEEGSDPGSAPTATRGATTLPSATPEPTEDTGGSTPVPPATATPQPPATDPPPTSPPATDPPPQPTDSPGNGGPSDDTCAKNPDIPPCRDN